MYYLWTIFALSYIPRALGESAAYAPLALIAMAALVLRLVERSRRTSGGVSERVAAPLRGASARVESPPR